jgi:hypothetical protein
MRSLTSCLSSVVVLAAALSSTPAQAAIIERVDLDAGHVFIHGAGFGSRAPHVRLAGTTLTVVSHSPTDIVAEAPPGLTAGDYLLTVRGGGRTSTSPRSC